MKEVDLIQTSSMYEELPFLYHFPFTDKYKIFNSDDGISDQTDEYTKYDILELINFEYSYKKITITISFFKEDIEFIHENSNKISKFDKVLKEVEDADHSNSFEDKVKAIKVGNSLIKKIDEEMVPGDAFNSMLDLMLKDYDIVLPDSQLKKIKKLSSGLLNMNLEGTTRNIVDSYLSLHLNRIKILIGLVIASKLY